MHGLRELEYPYGRTDPMKLKKIRTSFSEKRAPFFAAPVCHPITFIDLGDTLLANRRSAKAKCTDSGSDSTHLDVAGPMNFEKRIRTSLS